MASRKNSNHLWVFLYIKAAYSKPPRGEEFDGPPDNAAEPHPRMLILKK